jgi:hypothetical protein
MERQLAPPPQRAGDSALEIPASTSRVRAVGGALEGGRAMGQAPSERLRCSTCSSEGGLRDRREDEPPWPRVGGEIPSTPHGRYQFRTPWI